MLRLPHLRRRRVRRAHPRVQPPTPWTRRWRRLRSRAGRISRRRAAPAARARGDVLMPNPGLVRRPSASRRTRSPGGCRRCRRPRPLRVALVARLGHSRGRRRALRGECRAAHRCLAVCRHLDGSTKCVCECLNEHAIGRHAAVDPERPDLDACTPLRFVQHGTGLERDALLEGRPNDVRAGRV